MKIGFLLNGSNIKLATEEIKALFNVSNFQVDDGFLICNTNKDNLFKRVSFSKKIYKILFVSNKNNLLNDINNFDFSNIYKDSFRVRFVRLSKDKFFNEADIAEYVGKNISKSSNVSVDIDNAKTRIDFIFTKNNIYCCLLLYDVKKDYLRRNLKYPYKHPTIMKPRLARALINLTGAINGKIYDPFCGAGGILVEAGLMGFNVKGYDVDKFMVERCINNGKHFGVNIDVKQMDSTKINKKMEYVVTDLPYGRSSKISEDIKDLYVKFLSNLKKNLVKRAVVVFPNFFNYKKVVDEIGFDVVCEVDYYVHNGLTRKIVVLENK